MRSKMEEKAKKLNEQLRYNSKKIDESLASRSAAVGSVKEFANHINEFAEFLQEITDEEFEELKQKNLIR